MFNLLRTEKEYDHLDYSRPGNSFKPHYHQLADSMKKNSNMENDLNMNDTSNPSEKEVSEKKLNVNVTAPVAQPESVSDDDNKLDDEGEDN